MATIQVSDGALQAFLGDLVNAGTPPASFSYHLFVNDITPTPATSLGTFTECTTSGYSSQAVTASGWSVASVTSGHWKATNDPVTFTLADAVTLYGYFVKYNGTDLGWSQRFDSPVVITGIGGSIIIEPTLESLSPIP